MNYKIFKLTGILLLSVVFLFSCESDDKTETRNSVKKVNISNSTKTLNTFINFESVPTFKSDFFSPTEMFVYTTPSNNLTFKIPAKSIMKKGGGALPNKLSVVVREYLTISDMLVGGVQTTSDGKMLVTGGNFYWYIEDENGNTDYEVQGNVQVEMKVSTDITDSDLSKMSYYVGEQKNENDIETLNWKLGRAETWVGREGEEGDSNSFFIFGLDIGWTNCDYLYDFVGDEGGTQFKVQLKAKESYNINATRLFLVSKTFPSVVNITDIKDGYYETYKASIPKDLDAKIIAIGENKDGKVFYGDLDIKVKGDDTFMIELKSSTQDEIKSRLMKN